MEKQTITQTTDNVKRMTLLRMSERNEHILVIYKRYHQFLAEIDRLKDVRSIANDTVDDTLSIDQTIQHYESRVNDCSASLNWTAKELGLDASEGVKFRVFI